MSALAQPERQLFIDPAIHAAAQLLADGDAESALARLAPFLGDERPCLPARFVLAMAAWRMARLDWAIDLLRFCHEHWPMDRDVAEALASLYAQSGNLVDCVFMGKLGTALGGPGALAPFVPEGFPPFELAIANIRERPLLEAAKISLAAGALDDAIAKARQHVALNREDAEGSAFCAAALLRAGQPADAADALKAVEAEAECSAPLASLYATCLTAAGDAAEARRWHDQAVALAPRDRIIAAARAADAIWLDRDPARAGRAWLRRFCPAPKPRSMHPPNARLVIVYLVSRLADRRDAAAVAAVARAHDRSRVKVIAYGSGAQSWLENAALSGAFDEWRDIAALDAATLARSIGREGADLVIDVCGPLAPQSLLALAQRDKGICVGWIGNGALLDAAVYDATVVAASLDVSETRWAIAGGYPLLPVVTPAPRAERGTIHFGADVGLGQCDAETVAAWSALLQAAGEAKLLLRATDTGSGTVDRLVARFGRALAARIDLVPTESAEEFYALVDVALTPRRGVSPRAAADAVASGVPCVATDGSPAPYAAFLRHLGLAPDLVAADFRGYVEIALRLAQSAEARARIGAMARAAASDARLGAAHFAAALEAHAVRLLYEPVPA